MPRSCFVIIIFEFGSSVSLTRVHVPKKKIFICPSYKKFALQLKTNNILHEEATDEQTASCVYALNFPVGFCIM